MTLQQTRQAFARPLIVAAVLSLLAGCAPHTDASQAPAGMKVGTPLTPAEIQADDQQRAARKAANGD